MATQTALPFVFLEGVSAEITWAFTDADGDAVVNPAIETATLTLYDQNSLAIINLRDAQDILGPDKTGLNNVAIVNGVATWYVQPEDNIIVSGPGIEVHTALLQWSWDPDDGQGIRQGKFEIVILVQDLNMVTS